MIGPAAAQTAPPARNTDQHNLPASHLAIEGYDPVSYFPEGGATPAKGLKELTFTHAGATYRFATQANLDRFRANPARYEPAHGGWCTYAMGKDGTKVEVDPKSFVVADGRLFLFYKDFFNDTRKSFLKDQAALTQRADANWTKLSGESPRTAQTTTPATNKATDESMEQNTTLQARLDALRADFEKAAPADRIRIYNEGVQAVAAMGVMQSALKAGDPAPDFTLTDANGQPVTLADLLRDGPVVLTWYRGGWCPYCNLQLRAYQDILPDITALGARLVALSPELPDNSLSTVEKNKLAFTVLSDTGNAVAQRYGIAYTLPDSLIEAFKGRLDLPTLNGDDSWELPLAVTYIITTEGTIHTAFIDADYRKRAEPAAILEALRAID
jgi:peroxiredoxin